MVAAFAAMRGLGVEGGVELASVAVRHPFEAVPDLRTTSPSASVSPAVLLLPLDPQTWERAVPEVLWARAAAGEMIVAIDGIETSTLHETQIGAAAHAVMDAKGVPARQVVYLAADRATAKAYRGWAKTAGMRPMFRTEPAEGRDAADLLRATLNLPIPVPTASPRAASLWTGPQHLGLDDVFRLDALYPSKTAYLFPLTNRGLYSEVNLLVNAFAFSLLNKAHLFVDMARLPVAWGELFDTRFCDYADAAKGDYASQEVISIKGERALFDRVRDDFRSKVVSGEIVRVPELEFEGTIEQLNAAVAQLLFRPSVEIFHHADQLRAEFDLLLEPYIAIQLRGGDKLEGVLRADGTRTNKEGQAVEGDRYMAEIRRCGAKAKKILVITDDYQAFHDLAVAHPDYRFVTNCPTHMRGYFHDAYVQQDLGARTADAARMVTEVMLASAAELFLGPYRSNLSTFTHLLRLGRPSLSVDSQERWAPL